MAVAAPILSTQSNVTVFPSSLWLENFQKNFLDRCGNANLLSFGT
jgi:hypothetical protein